MASESGEMSAEERLNEVAEILADGLIRLKRRRMRKMRPTDKSQNQLDVLAETVIHCDDPSQEDAQ